MSDHGTDHGPPLGETDHAPITPTQTNPQRGWSPDHGTDHGRSRPLAITFSPPSSRGGNVTPGARTRRGTAE